MRGEGGKGDVMMISPSTGSCPIGHYSVRGE